MILDLLLLVVSLLIVLVLDEALGDQLVLSDLVEQLTLNHCQVLVLVEDIQQLVARDLFISNDREDFFQFFGWVERQVVVGQGWQELGDKGTRLRH